MLAADIPLRDNLLEEMMGFDDYDLMKTNMGIDNKELWKISRKYSVIIEYSGISHKSYLNISTGKL